MRLTWAQLEDLLLHEFVQSRHEGRDVAALEQRWFAATGGSLAAPVSGTADHPATAEHRALAGRMLDELDAWPDRSDPSHPETLSALHAVWSRARSTSRLTSPAERNACDLRSRLHGAWLGRAAGCLLGKPVEKIPRAGIRAIAEATGNWPVRGYFTAVGLDQATAAAWPWNRRSAATSLVENIAGMPEDDDLNYPLLNLALLEAHGTSFTTEQVATAWLTDLPAGRVFTAERAAYRNLLLAIPMSEVARTRNPFREWIGALIRGDVFGWVSPGDPFRAAELARRDATLSHTRNGIYGEMWSAALASCSLVARDVDELLAAAAEVVPPASELAAAIAFGAEVGRRTVGVDDQLDALHQRYGYLHWVHVLNNAATIACALTASRGDFGSGIGLAVMAGWDTDSAAATVGSVLGGLLGPSAIPDQWTRPLDNRIQTSLPGGQVRIDDLAARTARQVGTVP